MNRKRRISSELIYILAILILAFAVAMMSTADFGLSMIVAPAYILSQKLQVVTFGQSEYILQSILFLVFCFLMRRIRLVYFDAFLTCLIYGFVLDAWRKVVPLFNPAITASGSVSMPLRLFLFGMGVLLTALAVAMFFKSYFYPQVYDFFVKYISWKFHNDPILFKRIFDASCFLLACTMTLVFFGKFVGIGWGTVLVTIINGPIIGWFGRWLDRTFEIVPAFPKLAEKFHITE